MSTSAQAAFWIRTIGLLGLAGPCWLPSSTARAEAATEASPADGCPGPHGVQDPEAARVAFRAGQTAFNEGAYARAVDLWNQAYRDDCTAHALLLNLAMAQELLGRPDDAIHTLTLFNRRSPGSPYVEANVKRIEYLERSAAEKRRERARRERLTWPPANRPVPTEAATGVALPLVITVAGSAVAVTGGVLFLEGRLSASSADDRCGTRGACTELDGLVDGERARSRAEVGGWVAGAGLLTAVGGIVWHVLAEPSRPMDHGGPLTGLAWVHLPSGGGLSWSDDF